MIIIIIIYAILISLAGVFKAVSDICADHYDKSIFTKYNPEFWDKSISWKNKWIGGDKVNGHKKGLKYWDPISDAWHISNGFMISSFIAAGIFFPIIPIISIIYSSVIIFICSGILFTVVFNTFYNHIFIK